MNSVQYKLFLTHPSLFPLNGNGGANIDICRSGKTFYDTLNNMPMGSTTNLVFSKSNLDELGKYNQTVVEDSMFFNIIEKAKAGERITYYYQTISYASWKLKFDEVITELENNSYCLTVSKGVAGDKTNLVDFSCSSSGCTFVESDNNKILFKLLNLLVYPINSPSFELNNNDINLTINLKSLKSTEYEENKNISFVLKNSASISNNDSTLANIQFVPYNLLLKGVPGTGKSRLIDKLIKKIEAKPNQVLRINIHNGTNNSDLMQGIGVKTKEDNAGIIYSEKQGAVLEHLLNAIVNPTKNYVLVLEEIQENSLNKIIGDLIYLIEIDKRTQISENQINPIDREHKFDFVERLVSEGKVNGSIKIPSLVENKKPNNLIVPTNFYVFCTSNYRDDKKVIEDNLLRRFDVIELYPDVEAIDKSSIDVRDFFKNLNLSIEIVMESQDTHPDRFTIGHANWVKETNINKPLLKTIIEFKDVKNIPFDIVKKIFEQNNSFCGNYAISLNNNSKKLLEYNNYKDLISDLQKVVYSDLLNNEN